MRYRPSAWRIALPVILLIAMVIVLAFTTPLR